MRYPMSVVRALSQLHYYQYDVGTSGTLAPTFFADYFRVCGLLLCERSYADDLGYLYGINHWR
jgi:hypothetical protein